MNDGRRPVPAASSVAARGCRWATTRLARMGASGSQGGAGSVWFAAPCLGLPTASGRSAIESGAARTGPTDAAGRIGSECLFAAADAAHLEGLRTLELDVLLTYDKP